MVDLDADHRAHHVLEELRTYSPLVSPGCYLVVEDSFLGGRPVRPDAVPGPSEALDAWLAEDPPFEPDRWRERYLLTQNPRGYLRRIAEDGAPPIGRERPETFFTGALELTGVDGNGAAASAVDTEPIADELEAAAGEPDLEVEALRKTIGNLARGDRQARGRCRPRPAPRRDHDRRACCVRSTPSASCSHERNRLLERERARPPPDRPRVLPYRVYLKLQGPAAGAPRRRPPRPPSARPSLQATREQRAEGAARSARSASSTTTAASEVAVTVRLRDRAPRRSSSATPCRGSSWSRGPEAQTDRACAGGPASSPPTTRSWTRPPRIRGSRRSC